MQSPLPLLIFANPISGRGKGKMIAARLQNRLKAQGYNIWLCLENASHIPPHAIPANAIAAIVIGGDGTLRSVAHRLFADLNPPPPLLIIPMGTANLMGKHLGISWDDRHLEDQVLAALRNHRIVQLDTASANGHLMLLVAGVGLDAAVVHQLHQHRSGPINYFTYALPLLRAIAQYNYPPLSITLDGQHVFGPASSLVFIGNVPQYGTGFPLLPHASPTDSLLDVCILPCRARHELIAHALRAAAGEHLHGEGVLYRKAKRIRIDSETPIPIQVDGEPAGHTPLDIHLLPTPLRFIVPHQ